jgi:type I restriction enzyme S subunit
MSWKKIKLGELYTVHNGLSKGRQFFGKGHPFLSFSTVFNYWFLPQELDSLVESTEKEREACSIKRGDVFITRTSETMDELGMSSVALQDYPNATYNGFTKRLRPINDKLLPEYIGYYLRSPKFRSKFMAFSSMTTRASLSNDNLLSMDIEMPPIKAQRRIASILSRYDDLIENYQKQIKLLEEAAQRIYKEWFVDLRFPGYEEVKIVDGVPEGWGEKTVGSLLCKSHKTKQIPSANILKEGIIPVIDQSRDFIAGYTNDLDSVITYKYPIIVFGDHTRILKYIPFPFARGADGTQLLISNDQEKMPQSLFYLSLINVDLSNYSYARHFKYLKNETIVVPNEKVAILFRDTISAYFDAIQNCRNAIIYLTEARDRLLPKLINGEIEVEPRIDTT